MDELTLLKQQYDMVCGSRAVVLDFIEQHLAHQLHTPVPAFVNKTVAYLLAHNANVYLHWLANFSMQQNRAYFNDESNMLVSGIRAMYIETNEVANEFLNHYTGKLHEPVYGVTSSGKKHLSNPLEVFTHVLTHEFHHKGQILTMFRLLGHTPPDSDIIRT